MSLNRADEPLSVHRSREEALRAARAYVAEHPGAAIVGRFARRR